MLVKGTGGKSHPEGVVVVAETTTDHALGVPLGQNVRPLKSYETPEVNPEIVLVVAAPPKVPAEIQVGLLVSLYSNPNHAAPDTAGHVKAIEVDAGVGVSKTIGEAHPETSVVNNTEALHGPSL